MGWGLQILSAATAIAAAACWFRSTSIATPSSFGIHTTVSEPPVYVPGPAGGGRAMASSARSAELEQLALALRRQSSWSKWGAGLAGVSALVQAGSDLLLAR